MNVQKSIEMTNAKIAFVSLVDKAANKRKFLIAKSDGQGDFTTLGKVLKVDKTAHHITGVVYEPLTKDTDDNYMTAEEIRKAAYHFAKNGNKVDMQHNFEPAEGVSVVETYIAPADMEVGGQTVTKGTWVMTVEIQNEEVWKSVEKGDITGFSMGGVCNYATVETEPEKVIKEAPEDDAGEKKGVLKRLAELFGFDVVAKGEEASEQQLQKQEEKELNKEEVQSMIDKVVKEAKEEIVTTLGAEMAKAAAAAAELEKKDGFSDEDAKDKDKQEVVKMEDVAKMVKDGIAEALEPIRKACGVPNNLNNEKPVEKSASIFDGFFV